MRDALVFVVPIYVLVSLIALLLLLYVAYVALRWVIRLLSACGRLGSEDALIRLLTLAVAIWAFPQLIGYLADVIPEFVRLAIVNVPPLVVQGSERAASLCSGFADAECLAPVASAWLQAWSVAIAKLFEAFRFSDLPVASTVFFLATWAALARILDRLLAGRNVISKGSAAATTIGQVLRRGSDLFVGAARYVSPVAWKNSLLVLVLAVAAYLSIASIVAIPYLQVQTTPPAEVSADKLRERLGKSMLSEKQYEARYPAILPGRDPFDDVKKVQGDIDAKTESGYSVLQQIIADQQKNREAVVSAWRDLRNAAFERQMDLLETAVNTYTVANLARKGVREQVVHFMDIDIWYRSALDDQEAGLQKCRKSIASVDSQLFMIYPQLQLVLLSASKDSSAALVQSVATIAGSGLSGAWSETRKACEPSYNAPTIPGRQELGAYLGAFGPVARWLLKIESLPLALITGMLGFGLLGAACSTFVRSGVRKVGQQPLVDDIAGVLIRGSAAAMVVFLAVYGGLAIYTSGNVEPNAYVVLFTCLVAAVFSETVWDWAHRRLRSELNIQGQQAGKKSRTKESE